MDEIVIQAMKKWPSVPHCYGWLFLDARGNWRMRDELAQKSGSHGDKITNKALLGFINRNYLSDDQGCWYFQNGAQRVYVELEIAPYIARSQPDGSFLLHSEEPLGEVAAVWMSERGIVLLQNEKNIAALDDRDVVHFLDAIESGGFPMSDQALLAWLAQPASSEMPMLRLAGTRVPICHVRHDEIPANFRFVPSPASK